MTVSMLLRLVAFLCAAPSICNAGSVNASGGFAIANALASAEPAATEALRADCGQICVDVFQSAFNRSQEFANSSAESALGRWRWAFQSLGDKAAGDLKFGLGLKRELFASAKKTHALSQLRGGQPAPSTLWRSNATPPSSSSALAASRSRVDSGATLGLLSSTACSTPMGCKARELIANKCSYVREVLQLIYQVVNLIAHVITIVISVLCGCLFVANQAVCVLASVPFLCSLPYNLYNAIFKMSVQLWESIKSTTSLCQVHGHALLSS